MTDSTDIIRYDLRIQTALREMIRGILSDVAREGLPGGHYFQITFRTNLQGVGLSKAMLNRFPQEMTIILQHQFGDLTVHDTTFEVILFFSGVAERLTIPFDTITGFFDPSVKFALKFEVNESDEAQGLETPSSDSNPEAAITAAASGPRVLHRTPTRGAISEPKVLPLSPLRKENESSASKEELIAASAASQATEAKPTENVTNVARKSLDVKTDAKLDASNLEALKLEALKLEALEESSDSESKVVSIDAFRRKQ